MKRAGILLLCLFLLAALCGGCSYKADKARTEELIVGVWDYIPEEDYYRYQYVFSESGTITQRCWAYDEDGNEDDISLGDTFGLRYEVIDGSTVTIGGSFSGVSNEAEETSISFPDENTMILGDTTYHRAES